MDCREERGLDRKGFPIRIQTSQSPCQPSGISGGKTPHQKSSMLDGNGEAICSVLG